MRDSTGTWISGFAWAQNGPNSLFVDTTTDCVVGGSWRMLTTPSPGLTSPGGFFIPQSGTMTGPPAAAVTLVHRTATKHATWTFSQVVEANNPNNLLAIAGAGAVVAVNSLDDYNVDVQYTNNVTAGAAWSLASSPAPDLNSPAGFVTPASGLVT
jgi:hypothetical protein